jgi:hypothetical protein
MVVVVAVACAGCLTPFDPADDIPHREVRTTDAAIAAILDETTGIRVYAVGEYHPTRDVVVRTSPLARFTKEIIGLLEPRAQHLVVEAWLDDLCQSERAGQISMEVFKVTERARRAGGELEALIATSRKLAIATHDLPMTCVEYDSVLDARGRVDFLRLLLMITDTLGAASRALVADGRDVIVYGGALHNDLYPQWPLEELSYAKALDDQLGGGVLEIDLVVPEIVAPMPLVRREPWFPLLGHASPDRVLVWNRGPNSYVVILPARDEAVANVARPLLAGPR